jgi:hypothetical protein
MVRKLGRRPGRPATGHIKVQFNIRPEVDALIIRDAAKQVITRSRYIENLVEATFRFKAFDALTPGKSIERRRSL